MRTLDVWANTKRLGRCSACHAPLKFAQIVQSGKWHPFNMSAVGLMPRKDENGRLVVSINTIHSHFATCPKARQFSRRGFRSRTTAHA